MKTNSKNGVGGQYTWQDYAAARETWNLTLLASPKVTQCAKNAAHVFVLKYFEYDYTEAGFKYTGRLCAYPSLRKLAEVMGVNVKTARKAVTNLEATGFLGVERRYDQGQKRHTANRYLAVLPEGVTPISPKGGVVQFCQADGQKWTRVVHTYGPGVVHTGGIYSMTNSMNYSSERFDGKEEGRKKGVAEEGGEERGFHAKAGTRELAAWEAYAQSRGETLDYSRKWGGAHVPSQWPPTE